MEQSGEHRIPASRDEVWEALNDPSVLCACIDGCESMERVADGQFDASVKAKIGPVRATFKARITLVDVDPPNGYSMQVDVKGGPAGFGKGVANVALQDAEAGTTVLAYDAKGNVSGKLAQIGSRLIDGVTRKMADTFFNRFVERMGGTAG